MQEKQWLNSSDLSDYLPGKPARATIYEWVKKNKIPFYKEGKKLLFLKSEIDEWFSNNKVMPSSEPLQNIETIVFTSTLKAIQLNNLSQNKPIPESSKELIHG